MKSLRVGVVGVFAIILVVAVPAFAGKRGAAARAVAPAGSALAADTSLVTQFLTDSLKVEDPAAFNMTLKFKQRLEKMPEAARANLDLYFSQQSAHTLGEIFRAFGRTEYNNAIALGPAGVGKSFLIDQLTILFSLGSYPEYLKAELGVKADGSASPYQVVREALLGQTDVVMVNVDLLSQDNTKSGKAFSSEEVRMRTILTGIFAAAQEEFRRTDASGKRIGRRTAFIFDEVATLPALVQSTLKKILDETGFRNPGDPVRSLADPGYMVMAMTTPDEFRNMVQGDSAVERRYAKVQLLEPTEADAFKIIRNKSDAEWTPLYDLRVSDDALKFLIRMRRFIDTPPLAMPASVLKATNDLFLAQMLNQKAAAEITLRDAQEFLMKKVGLTDIWFEGPKGEPPFHDFADRVKRLVVGQDEVVDKIADRMTAWARLGFGGDLPVFFLGGSSGSGKDTLWKALNEVMFGHDAHHLMFSIGGAEGFAINSIIEGPPLGNHRDGAQPLLVKALEQGPSTGLIAFNEGKDAPTEQLEKLKVFIESGEIRPMGNDSRVRPLKFPIFILGQWGEELFQNKTDAEIADIYGHLTQADIEQKFQAGKDGEKRFGAISTALLNRAKKTGGVFLLKPVAQKLFPRIIEISLRKIMTGFKANANIDATVSPALIQYIAKVSTDAGEGTRGLGATLIDFTETAISKAMNDGLPLRDLAVALDYQDGQVVVKSGDRVWKLNAEQLRRIKSCETKLTQR